MKYYFKTRGKLSIEGRKEGWFSFVTTSGLWSLVSIYLLLYKKETSYYIWKDTDA